eukprot:1930435-Lingulodinium_polyedra.AAC.1
MARIPEVQHYACVAAMACGRTDAVLGVIFRGDRFARQLGRLQKVGQAALHKLDQVGDYTWKRLSTI